MHGPRTRKGQGTTSLLAPSVCCQPQLNSEAPIAVGPTAALARRRGCELDVRELRLDRFQHGFGPAFDNHDGRKRRRDGIDNTNFEARQRDTVDYRLCWRPRYSYPHVRSTISTGSRVFITRFEGPLGAGSNPDVNRLYQRCKYTTSNPARAGAQAQPVGPPTAGLDRRIV